MQSTPTTSVSRQLTRRGRQLVVWLFVGLCSSSGVIAQDHEADQERAPVELSVLARVHFNTNVSNFVDARAFYGKLGFTTLSEFPDTNTLEMAQAIGINTPTSYDGAQGGAAGGYLLHGELISLGWSGGVIDLIEFTIPRNDNPPYAQLNRLGMTHAEMLTTNLDADYAHLQQSGVEFLSPPVTKRDGSRFAVFKDLDGTYYELVEVEGDADSPNASGTPHIQRLGAVNINVSNFAESAAWYGMFGYEQTARLDGTESAAVAAAMGFAEPFEIIGARFTHRYDGSELKLVQWLTPFNSAPPYPTPINHLGIHRMAFSTSDIEGDVALLQAQGVEMISPITPCCSGPDSWGGIVAFYDPDGTIMELVEQPMMTLMGWITRFLN
ncbi:MAG: VOC family protein [Pseudomonadota bacterium]